MYRNVKLSEKNLHLNVFHSIFIPNDPKRASDVSQKIHFFFVDSSEGIRKFTENYQIAAMSFKNKNMLFTKNKETNK